ncbi:MAG: hypothetical protein FWF46_08570 [Oscillospiraceae bacterium]|nr:hypothetical protein [Oscillospiraceae bacterium]
MNIINLGKTRRVSIAKTLFVVLLFAMFFVLLNNNKSFAATSVTLESVLFDGTNSNYIIYTNGYSSAFEYAFGNDLNNPPTVYYQCDKDKDGNNVVIVPKANTETAKYLYIKGDSNVYEVDYSTALDMTTADYLNNLTKIITISAPQDKSVEIKETNKTTTQTIQYVEVTDTNHTDMQYILTKLDANTAKALLNCLADLNDKITPANPNPADVILSMKQFWAMYQSLSSTNWVAVPSDKIIEEPLDTQTGDVYVLWLQGKSVSTGNVEKDMKILTCIRGETSVVTNTQIVQKLPKTGADFTLEGLLVINIILIGVVYLRIRNLKKKV